MEKASSMRKKTGQKKKKDIPLCKHETNFGSRGHPANLLGGLHEDRRSPGSQPRRAGATGPLVAFGSRCSAQLSSDPRRLSGLRGPPQMGGRPGASVRRVRSDDRKTRRWVRGGAARARLRAGKAEAAASAGPPSGAEGEAPRA